MGTRRNDQAKLALGAVMVLGSQGGRDSYGLSTDGVKSAFPVSEPPGWCAVEGWPSFAGVMVQGRRLMTPGTMGS